MLTLNDGRSELWQWDTGRKLTVDADCSQVHFSNKVFGRSIDVDVSDGVAIIPDVLLQTDKDLNVWAFVGTAENGYTKISKTFKINRRNKPADYVFTPVEQTTIAEIAAIAQSVRDDADAGLFDGKPGEDGRDGVDGKDGAPGRDGKDGLPGEKGDPFRYEDFTPEQLEALRGPAGQGGQPGRDGVDGKDGQDGYTPQKGVDYFDGAPGEKGDPFTYSDFTPEQLEALRGPQGNPGSDANVTAENIRSALGYTPADSADLSNKLTAPQTASVGQIFQIKSINADRSLTLEAVDMPSGGDVDDVQINGASIVSDGVANIPLCGNNIPGLVAGTNTYSVNVSTKGNLIAQQNTLEQYQSRDGQAFIGKGTLENIKYDVVKRAISDGIGEAWTDEEKTAAWKRQAMIKTAMDEIAVAGAQYYLGEQTAVDIVLPDDAEVGQMITFCWYNGETAATMSITGTMLAFDYAPTANTRSEINALWDGTYWAVIGNEIEVPNDVA